MFKTHEWDSMLSHESYPSSLVQVTWGETRVLSDIHRPWGCIIKLVIHLGSIKGKLLKKFQTNQTALFLSSRLEFRSITSSAYSSYLPASYSFSNLYNIGTQIPLARFFPQVASFFFNGKLPGSLMISLIAGNKVICDAVRRTAWLSIFLIFILQRRMNELLAQGLATWKASIWSQLPMGGAVLCHVSLNQSLVFWFWLRMLHCECQGLPH